MPAPLWVLGAALAGTFTFGGPPCGGDHPATPTTAITDTAPTTSMPGWEQPATVVDVAAGDERFSTLVTAVQAAGLEEALRGDGPFTVFAPTNDAFAALPAGTLDTLLLPENRDQLTSILTYHVVEGRVLSSDLTDGMHIPTLDGQTLTVGVTHDGYTLTDTSGRTATILNADIEAGNGVVHTIDTVLLPAAH